MKKGNKLKGISISKYNLKETEESQYTCIAINTFFPFHERKENTSVLNSPENNRKRENKKVLITREMAIIMQFGTNF